MLAWFQFSIHPPTPELFRLKVDGTNVTDEWGHTITHNMGILDGALVGDGGAKSAVVSGAEDFSFGMSNFEITADVYRTGNAPSGLGVLASRASVSTAAGFALLLSSNTPTIYLTDAAGTWKFNMGGGTTQLNQWTTCRVTRIGSTVSLYVGGVLVNSQSYTLGVNGTPSIPLSIGGNSDKSHPLLGRIKNVVIKRLP